MFSWSMILDENISIAVKNVCRGLVVVKITEIDFGCGFQCLANKSLFCARQNSDLSSIIFVQNH